MTWMTDNLHRHTVACGPSTLGLLVFLDSRSDVLLNIVFFPPKQVQTWDPEETLVCGRRASLSDLSCLEDIELLSVRQLKEILARNFVNYTGCCEKWELMERVRRLYREQQRLLGKCQQR